MSGRLGVLLAICCGVWSSPVASQSAKIRITVAVADSATGGLLTSAFSSAFRSLGDVNVVSAEEHPELVLDGIVLCEPRDWQVADHYVVSLRLLSPYDSTTGLMIARRLVPIDPVATRDARVNKALTVMRQMLWPYELTYGSWAAYWGRASYEQATRDLVRTIDSQCLDERREFHRLELADSAQSVAILADLSAKHWMC